MLGQGLRNCQLPMAGAAVTGNRETASGRRQWQDMSLLIRLGHGRLTRAHSLVLTLTDLALKCCLQGLILQCLFFNGLEDTAYSVQ